MSFGVVTKSSPIYRYSYDKPESKVGKILTLSGVWSNDNLSFLLELLPVDKVVLETKVNPNIAYILKKYTKEVIFLESQNSISERIKLQSIDNRSGSLIEKERSFLVSIFKMNTKILRINKFSEPRKEIFRFYFYKAFMKIGNETLPLMFLISSILGIAMVLEGYSQLKYIGVEMLTMQFFVKFAIREMIPVIISMLMASKSGSSIASVFASMNISGEFTMMKIMRIGKMNILKPYFIVFLVLFPLMNILSIFFCLILGMLAYKILLKTTIILAVVRTVEYISLSNFLISEAKSLLFGYWTGLCVCAAGMFYNYGTENVGKSVTKAVVYSVSGILLLDIFVMFVCNVMKI
ncbi:ABC transporter permease [Candidatus Nesciobacter abundans]|uniref:ABC transporter permease n=1 Tax=Candidatus Nesciobacter abundans TaxID=2601668 RepID=A0A5C0UGT4_9PROT|nr:ABC transporter permease [Candidatus Nesciobacter abundans]QEK39019.1 ABC transporter permease [Candidatus Nesciobacter abundans]